MLPRAVSAYSVFYKEQFKGTKEAFSADADLGKVAAAIAGKWKALSEADKKVGALGVEPSAANLLSPMVHRDRSTAAGMP